MYVLGFFFVFCFCFFLVFFFSLFVCLFVLCLFRVVVFFLLQNAPIAMIFNDAIYLFIYFLHFISMLLRPSPILKTIQKMGERNEKKTHFTTANK